MTDSQAIRVVQEAVFDHAWIVLGRSRCYLKYTYFIVSTYAPGQISSSTWKCIERLNREG